MNAVVTSYERWSSRATTGQLNQWLEEISNFKPHPAVNVKNTVVFNLVNLNSNILLLYFAKGKPVRFKYITQARTRPPTFVLFGNRNEVVNDSYVRFLTNSLRTELGLEVCHSFCCMLRKKCVYMALHLRQGAPIRLTLKQKTNPFLPAGLKERR